MQFYNLPADRDSVRRFTAELWLPFNRELEEVAEAFDLAEELDISAEVDFRMGLLEEDSYQVQVAVDGEQRQDDESLATVEDEFLGFITTDINEAPTNFDRPDRLLIGDFYVKEGYRGDGLAQQFMDWAVGRARENECGELTLDVDIDNERARAFYDKYNFEPTKMEMIAPVEGV